MVKGVDSFLIRFYAGFRESAFFPLVERPKNHPPTGYQCSVPTVVNVTW